MALPALGAAAKVTGKRALGAVTAPLADMKDQITSPIMQMVNPVKDLYKEIKSEMGSGDADKTADAVKESGDKQVTSIDQVNQSIIKLTDTLESYFSKQSEMAEGQLKSDILDPSTSMPDPDAVSTLDDGGEESGPSSKIGKSLAPIINVFKGLLSFSKILKAAAIGVAIPALISFFQSDAFVKIKEFVVDKWPNIKEFFVKTFETVLTFFEDIGGVVSTLFDSETSFGEKLKAVFVDLPAALIKAIGGLAENALNLIGEFFDVEALGTKIKDGIIKFIAAIPGGSFVLKSLGVSVPEEAPEPQRPSPTDAARAQSVGRVSAEQEGANVDTAMERMGKLDTTAKPKGATPERMGKLDTTTKPKGATPVSRKAVPTPDAMSVKEDEAALAKVNSQLDALPARVAGGESVDADIPVSPTNTTTPAAAPTAVAAPASLPEGVTKDNVTGLYRSTAYNVEKVGYYSKLFKTPEEAEKYIDDGMKGANEYMKGLEADFDAYLDKQESTKPDLSPASATPVPSRGPKAKTMAVQDNALESTTQQAPPIIVQNNTNNTSTQNSPTITSGGGEKASVPLN